MHQIVQRARVKLVEAVRHGQPEVAWTPEFMGLGNVLYLFLWAAEAPIGRRAVLVNDKARPWLAQFPNLAQLAVERSDVPLRHQRVMPWGEDAAREARGLTLERWFTRSEMDSFVKAFMLPGPLLNSGAVPRDPERLVVNVRRGDYYSVPDFTAILGFDQVAYLRAALEQQVVLGGVPPSIHVVSDGIDWCQEHLGWMSEVAPTTFSDRARGMFGDFQDVAMARRLILTNTTFGYWAGYTSNALHGDNGPLIVAPRFFMWDYNRGRSFHLHDDWTVIEELPNGW